LTIGDLLGHSSSGDESEFHPINNLPEVNNNHEETKDPIPAFIES
jgi:hypothetical protein